MRWLGLVLAVLGSSRAAAEAPAWPAGAALQLARSEVLYDAPARNEVEQLRRAGVWRVDLAWPAAANASTYRVLRNGKELAKFAAADARGRAFQHNATAPFRYAVQAGDGKGGWSVPLESEFRDPTGRVSGPGGSGGSEGGVSGATTGLGTPVRGRIPGWKAETVEEKAAPQFDPNRVRFAFDALGIELTRCEALLGLAGDVRSIELHFALDAANGKVTQVRLATLSPETRALEACVDTTLRAFRVPRVPEPGTVAGVVRLVRPL